MYVAGRLGMSDDGGLRDPLGFADSECQWLADHARPRLSGTFRAWLSTNNPHVDAQSRLRRPSDGAVARGWIRSDGRPFADRIPDSTGKIFYPLVLDESKKEPDHSTGRPLIPVATGTDSNGNGFPPPYTANDWMSLSLKYRAGEAVATTGMWSGGYLADEGTSAHLYCLGVDHNTPLTIPKPSGRLAFVSSAAFVIPSDGGIAAADDWCSGEASDAGLPGEYRALLSTSTVAASDPLRFNAKGSTWFRLDGIPWLYQATDLAVGSIPTALNLDPDGTYQSDSLQVWTGATDPGSPSVSRSQACGDWGSPSGSGIFGWVSYSEALSFNALSLTAPCGEAQTHLYCLQR
jgi:hypothetical protein